MKKLFELLAKTLESGEDAVLVSVVASSGSTPRGSGARMLITKEGRVRGTIGGGAVEHHSEEMAAVILKNKKSRLERFRLRKNEILDLGMICGGDVSVYFQYIPAGDAATLALAKRVEALFEAGRTSWLVLDITEAGGGAMAVVTADGETFGPAPPPEVTAGLDNFAKQIEAEGRVYFCEKLVQGGRVYIFGGGHVSQALVPVLVSVDFRCVVLEDREDFCHESLFPGVEQTMLIDIERIADFVTITDQDYVAVMTRGHKDDRIVQAQALRTPARYIGVIGSAAKKAGVFAKLKEEGFTESDLARVKTPIGLDIKAETPAEIAVSIAGELIEVRSRY